MRRVEDRLLLGPAWEDHGLVRATQLGSAAGTEKCQPAVQYGSVGGKSGMGASS